MRKSVIILVGLLLYGISLHSQETKRVYNTIVFPKDMPHSAFQSNAPQKDIPLEIYGTPDFLTNFNSIMMSNAQVIACIKNQKKSHQYTLSLSPEVDFDALKNILQATGVEYISIEDTIIPFSSWKTFTTEQVRKLWEYNFTLTNLEAKRNWVLQNPDKIEMAKQNGWLEENSKLIEKTIRQKKEFLSEILK